MVSVVFAQSGSSSVYIRRQGSAGGEQVLYTTVTRKVRAE